MAELFLAEVQGLGGFHKQVVLKRILPQLAENTQFVRMFLDEARLAATLHHPNIAQVYDIGRDGQSSFFSLEYVEGRDLRDVCRAFLRRGEKIPLEHACTIVAQAAAGLHYAHEKLGPDGEPLHVVHRDVSPANVLVTYEGSVKIVDFGVAKARTQQSETRAGTLKGKISYMSPEQCDVFALGILLFELSTGTRLFRGDNEFKVMTRIVNEDAPSPTERRVDYLPGLAAIVKRALARDRAERYATAEEMQLAIEELSRELGFKLSTVALGQYMRDLFRAEIEAEREGARRRPLPLTDEEREDLGVDDDGGAHSAIDDVPEIEVVNAEVGESVKIAVGLDGPADAKAPPRRSRRKQLLLGVAAVACAALVGAVAALAMRKPPAPAEPVAAAPAPTSPAPELPPLAPPLSIRRPKFPSSKKPPSPRRCAQPSRRQRSEPGARRSRAAGIPTRPSFPEADCALASPLRCCALLSPALRPRTPLRRRRRRRSSTSAACSSTRRGNTKRRSARSRRRSISTEDARSCSRGPRPSG
jgi:tRNA A-37 threonylcarbamoyl transferase component Bud32